MPMTFVRPRLLRFNGKAITDHNRSELGVSVERIETRNRMANGTLRKYFVADKHTFTVSWTDIPNLASQTVDGFWSGREMNNFYLTNVGPFTLGVTGRDGVERNYTVVFTDFSYSIKKRFAQWEIWDVQATMEEV